MDTDTTQTLQSAIRNTQQDDIADPFAHWRDQLRKPIGEAIAALLLTVCNTAPPTREERRDADCVINDQTNGEPLACLNWKWNFDAEAVYAQVKELYELTALNALFTPRIEP
jgi:hypothetical protein